jgi:molecular chaperone GrpE
MSAESTKMTENFEAMMNEDATIQGAESTRPEGSPPADQSPEEMASAPEAGESFDAVDAATLADSAAEAPVQDELFPAAADSDVLTQLATEMESLRLQVEERTSQYMRIAADFDNFRKRTEREKSELELRVKRDAISELLPVIDSFEMARTQIKPQTEQEINIHKSYQGVYKQLVDGLKRIGVSPMRAEGQAFDPNYHDAIMREATNEFPEGTVIEDLRRGYLLGDIVLRHAMVKVATQADEAEGSSNEEELPAE